MTKKCGKCGGGSSFCRDTPNGWYCSQHGLVFDAARLQHPSPDPQLQAVDNDPEVCATVKLETEAQQHFDEASARWEAALVELAGIRLKAAADSGEFSPSAGGWRPSLGVRKLARRERELDAAVETFGKERESAGANLLAARLAHADAVRQARLANGLGVMPANERPRRDLAIGGGAL